MEINAAIQYRGTTARYVIKREKPGIYLASLAEYQGGAKDLPPLAITMTRGIRYWTGSCDFPTLLLQLGEKIEAALRAQEDPGKQKTNRN